MFNDAALNVVVIRVERCGLIHSSEMWAYVRICWRYYIVPKRWYLLCVQVRTALQPGRTSMSSPPWVRQVSIKYWNETRK
jgi:hypothetical protein